MVLDVMDDCEEYLCEVGANRTREVVIDPLLLLLLVLDCI